MDAPGLRRHAARVEHAGRAALEGGLPTDALLIARNGVRDVACLLDGEARHRHDRALRGLARQAWAVSSQLGWVARQADGPPSDAAPMRETVEDLRAAVGRAGDLSAGIRVHADLWDAESLRPLPVAGQVNGARDPLRGRRLQLVATVLEHAAGYGERPAGPDERVTIVTDQVERALDVLWRDGETSRDPAVRDLRVPMVRAASLLTAGADLYRDLLTAPEQHGRAVALLQRAGQQARAVADGARMRAATLLGGAPAPAPGAATAAPLTRAAPGGPAVAGLGGVDL